MKNLNDTQANSNLERLQIYNLKLGKSFRNHHYSLDDYELVPKLIVSNVAKELFEKRQSKSFYHFSRALNSKQCLSQCVQMKTTMNAFVWKECNLVIAKLIIGEDWQTGRKQYEVEVCFFIEYLYFFYSFSYSVSLFILRLCSRLQCDAKRN